VVGDCGEVSEFGAVITEGAVDGVAVAAWGAAAVGDVASGAAAAMMEMEMEEMMDAKPRERSLGIQREGARINKREKRTPE
jgi:hypothetical protein